MMQVFTFQTVLRGLASLGLLCFATALSAQLLDIRGIVTDPDGKPLVGVTVRVLNAANRGTESV